MISRNLRHLRLFLAVGELNSLTRASARCHVSQPAVSQAIGKLERGAGGALFERTRQGFFLSERGEVLVRRVRRALSLLDGALADISPRLCLTATAAQLQALIAMREAENFTLAARRLGLSQPTVHRAVTQVERDAARLLFERTSFGMVATRPCRALTQAARLAFSELDQAESDLADFDGREVGRIVIGSLPLSRSVILPRALAEFRRQRPILPVTVIDGPYDGLLSGLRRGDIDFMVGALRSPAPIGDVDQEALFDDRLVILSGNQHVLAGRDQVAPNELARYPWIVPRSGTPTREQFDSLFSSSDLDPPASVLESGSILLMREMLNVSDHLGCISRQQAEAEISKGLLSEINIAFDWPGRAIGVSTRRDWVPTAAQALLLDLIRSAARA